MKNVMKATATAAAAALALGGFSLAVIQPAAATGSTTPETATAGISQEVGAYLYKKIDPAKSAAWENSGPQRLLEFNENTTKWFEAADIMSLLPPDTCGPGWAIQQDKLDIIIVGTEKQFEWPLTLNPPTGFDLAGRASLTADRHDNLEEFGTVPDCETPTDPPTTPPAEPTPKPSPSPTPDPTPSPKPSPTPEATPPAVVVPGPTPEATPPAVVVPQPKPTPPAVVVPKPTPTPPAAVTPGQQLPETGANPAMAALAGAGILVAGLGTVALVRNRRRADSADA